MWGLYFALQELKTERDKDYIDKSDSQTIRAYVIKKVSLALITGRSQGIATIRHKAYFALSPAVVMLMLFTSICMKY